MFKGMELLSSQRCFNGEQRRYRFESEQLNGSSTVGVFLPPSALVTDAAAVPALIWLSGLTCTDENFVQKAGAQRRAAELGLALITPDTSPRGNNVPTDSSGQWDFGCGAGFYVDAEREPWSKHYRMHSFVLEELLSGSSNNGSIWRTVTSTPPTKVIRHTIPELPPGTPFTPWHPLVLPGIHPFQK